MGASIWSSSGTPLAPAASNVLTERQIATAGQTVFNLTTFTYVTGGNALRVFRNGQLMTMPDDYTETSDSSFTFTTTELNVGDEIFIIGNNFVSPGHASDPTLRTDLAAITGATLVGVTPTGTVESAATVQQAIAELAAPSNSTTSPAVILSTPTISVPDPTKAFKEVTRYEGGETKFGKWREYHNAAEWGWGITYNFSLDPYSVYPPASTTRDAYNTTASSCAAMRFDVAEGSSGMNFWAVEWAPPSTTKTVPDWAWGPDLYFYQGDVIGGTPGDSGGLLRLASSAGRISGFVLESNNTASNRSYISRTTFEGAYEVADISVWTNWNSMPGAAIGTKRLQLRTYGLKAYQGTLTNVQRVVPADGATVTASYSTELLAIDPGAPIAALTVLFPDVTASGLDETGRKFTVTAFNTVTTLTLSAVATNISGTITTLTQGTASSWVYYTNGAGINTWFKV